MTFTQRLSIIVLEQLELAFFGALTLIGVLLDFREENVMAKMECPRCGEKFDEEYIEYLDNGNPACPHCVAEERKRIEEKEKQNGR